ncbi:Fe-S protein assembly chaperone HscA, partial [Burkholderia contaminans]
TLSSPASAVRGGGAQAVTAFDGGATPVGFDVVHDGGGLVADCGWPARCGRRGIPPVTAGAARVRVTYRVDADGLLSVFAREQLSGVEASVVVKPSYGLADDDIAKMLEDSFKTAEIDMRARALREAQVEAERMLEATQAALAADGELLDADERTQVDTLAAALRAVAQGDDTNAIEAATKALADGTDEFAARRMDKSIKRALSGRRLDEI